MIKRCSGCGVILQDIDKDKVGYVNDLSNNLCMRCFKLKHYNVLIGKSVNLDNGKILESINKKNVFVLFLIDFLNIYDEVIDIYKKIKNEKVLVITKGDLIPKNIKKDALIKNIKNIYDIKEDIYLCSSKTKENINIIANICNSKRKCLLAGFTNAGKSSIINVLLESDNTVSRNANTTQDFIKLQFDGGEIIDAPGFLSKSFFDASVPKKQVVPITYQLANKYYLKIGDLDLQVMEDTNLTIYLQDTDIEKRKVNKQVNYNIIIPKNSDLVIKGLGFIRFSKATRANLNIVSDYYEVRPSVVGGSNEN